MNEEIVKKGLIKGCLMPLLLILIVLILILIFVGGNSKSSNTNRLFNSIMKRVASLNDEQLNNLNEIFLLCQINEIVDAKEFQVGESKTSYHLNDKETRRHSGVDNAIVLWLNNDDKSISEIYYHDNDIYIDGQLINVITKFYIPEKLYEEYRIMGQLALKTYMKHPDTMKYKDWKDGVINGTDTIQVTVTSKNDFNIDMTSQVQFEYDRNSKRLTKIYIDGKQVY